MKNNIRRVNKNMEILKFETAFKYPFNRAVGMWNILWVFVPIVGWFALGGYSIRLVKEFARGEFKELPVLNFGSDLELGFMMFIKSLPFVIVYMITISILEKLGTPLAGVANFFMGLFVVPMLGINFFIKETVESFFDFSVLSPVFNNLEDYLMVLLRSIGLSIIFFFMMIVLVGIPASAFTKNIFLADFYRRKIAK